MYKYTPPFFTLIVECVVWGMLFHLTVYGWNDTKAVLVLSWLHCQFTAICPYSKNKHLTPIPIRCSVQHHACGSSKHCLDPGYDRHPVAVGPTCWWSRPPVPPAPPPSARELIMFQARARLSPSFRVSSASQGTHTILESTHFANPGFVVKAREWPMLLIRQCRVLKKWEKWFVMLWLNINVAYVQAA